MTISQEILNLVKENLLKGKKKEDIANMLNISIRTVYNVQNGIYDIPKTNKRKRKQKRNENIVKRAATALRKLKTRVSSSKIQALLPCEISQRSIRRHLVSSGFRYRKNKQKIILTAYQKAERVRIVKQWICENINFDKIIFSDECKFSLDGDDNYMTWSKTEMNDRKRRAFHGGSIMVWGCMSITGILLIRRLEKTVNSELYINLLENDIFPILINKTDTFIWQQDNARPHTSRNTKEMLLRNNVRLLEWPPYSPDLSPIEKIWSILKNRLYSTDQFVSKDELWVKIVAECEKLRSENGTVFQNLYRRFKENICEIISNGGNVLC